MSSDFRPVNNNLHFKLLTGNSKKNYETLINHISNHSPIISNHSPKYSMLKNHFKYLQEHQPYRNIYFKIYKMPPKKLAELNYRIMHNILICSKYLSKGDDSTD